MSASQQPTLGTTAVLPPATRQRRGPGRAFLAQILVFDAIGPLLVYYGLRSSGMSSVGALLVSGAVPALGVGVSAVTERRLDLIGVLVLSGIAIASALGLATRNAHLVLLDGTVPTALFGAICISSLAWRRPLIYQFALESMGASTPAGLDFTSKWQYAGFRHAFRVATVVWGVGFLLEAAMQAVIIETTSTGTAKLTSTLLPFFVVGCVIAWNSAYAKRKQAHAGA
ncbi:MAG: VC0807 family protein [Acidimicrobiales bacterium]